MVMHAASYLFVCIASIISVGAMRLEPTSVTLLGMAAWLISLVGVPHGGLDHWTGRRLCQPKVGAWWSPLFFLSYLATALLVAWTWEAFPIVMVPAFFLLSAWHFGREDASADRYAKDAWKLPDHSKSIQPMPTTQPTTQPTRLGSHIKAIALGGVVIGVPALARPAEMTTLLVPLAGGDEMIASSIVEVTRWAAFILVPIATGLAAFRLAGVLLGELANQSPSCSQAGTRFVGAICGAMIVPVTIMVSVMTPILFSFCLYFCGWHSIQGLCRLRREENLTWTRFAWSVAPLSLLAVIGIGVAGQWLGQMSIASLADSDLLRLTFIGLASIAVPHVLVHEVLASDAFRSLAGRISQPVSSSTSSTAEVLE